MVQLISRFVLGMAFFHFNPLGKALVNGCLLQDDGKMVNGWLKRS